MSVLNRKLFAPVGMHSGGVPPHAPEGHKHNLGNSEYSDEQVRKMQIQQRKELEEEESGLYTGIMEGFGEATDQKGVIDPETLAAKIYPTRSAAELREEAEKIYSTDLSAERAEVERQKQEDIAAGMIGFGARLMTGRGNALDVLGQAAEETLPEFMAARRATRKDVISLKGQEKKAKQAISAYVMTKQQEDDAKKAQLMIDAVFKNLDFTQEIEKANMLHEWDLESIVVVNDTATGNSTEITMGEYLEDMKLPATQRKFLKATDYNAPFEAYDSSWGVNRLFTNYEAFDKMNKANPRRFEGKRDDLGPTTVKDNVVGNFTHPTTNDYVRMYAHEMSDGTYMIPEVDQDGFVILQSNGQPVMIPLGAGARDFVPGQKVELQADDLLPAKVQMEQLSTILLYDRNIRSIDKIITNIADDRQRAGIMATINEMVQIGQGMITDILDADQKNGIFLAVKEEIKNIDRIAETPQDAAAIRALFDPENPASAEFFGDFDPALAENRTRANAIAYAVARARKTSGRLNLDDIRRAAESLKISGFRDARTAIVELNTIRGELSDANDDMKLIYKYYGGDFPEGYTGTKTVKDENQPKLFYDKDGKIIGIEFPWETKK
jgi:hypothetical protein